MRYEGKRASSSYRHRFEKELVLKVGVNEIGVAQILANVIHGT